MALFFSSWLVSEIKCTLPRGSPSQKALALPTDKRTEACSRPLCYTLKFSALLTFSGLKFFSYKKRGVQKKVFCNFSVRKLQCFLDPKKVKKWASKVAHNRPKSFISQARPTHSPELIFHTIKCREQASVLLSVALPKWPINQFILDHQSRQHAVRDYCPNIYTVPGRLVHVDWRF